jgi:hypothetical protein
VGGILLHGPTDIPITIRPDTEMQLIGPHSFIQSGELQGANMAVRRSLLANIGGFDPKFGKGSQFKGGEDLDLEARSSQQQLRLPPLQLPVYQGAGSYQFKRLLDARGHGGLRPWRILLSS